jgi:hypothetical protein
MEALEISDYLHSYEAETRRGTCILCNKLVGWSRRNLSSHKRASCKDPQFFIQHPSYKVYGM